MQWPVRFRHDTPEAEDYWTKTWGAYEAAKGGGGSGAASSRASGPLQPPTTEERLGGWHPAKCRTGAETGS
eukprot:5094422-Lingulodinium_polyedra.AAC.1